MNKINRLSVGKQVTFLFGLICALLVAIGALLFFSLRSIERSNQEQQARALNKLALIDDMTQDVGQMQADVLREVLASDVGEVKDLDQTVLNIEKTNAEELTAYQKFMDTEEQKQLYDKVMQARKMYWEQTQSVLAFGLVNQDAAARKFINETQAPAYDEYLKASDELTYYMETAAKETARATSRFISRTRVIGDALAGIALFFVIGTGFVIVRIGRRLKEDNIVLQTEVAERKRAEETLRESEEKFRQLADNISDVFWMTSPDLQKTLYVSPAYELIWGRSSKSLYDHPQEWAEAIVPEERARVFALFSKLKTGAPSVSAEFQITRPGGEMRWIHSRGFPVRDVANRVIRLTGIAIDITERKQAEESLQLLNSAVKQSKESIVITDAELDLPGPKILFVNPAFTKMTGYTAKEALGKTPRMLQGPRTDKSVLSRLRKNLEKGEVFEGETINYRKNGEEFNIEWQIAPIRNSNRKITHFVAIQHDISERKRLEAQLFQSQKMETIGKLAGGVAHEFNSIMTAIIGQSEMILGDLPQENPATQRAIEIRNAADRASSLTRQLLAYGRKQILQPEILDLNKVLTEMTGTLQHLMGKEVKVQIIPSPELKTVKIDPGQMEQVLLNIAMNAADAMPNGGKFVLETANITLDEEYVRPFSGLKSGDYVMLAISDTGVGMSEEIKARVFEPFFSTKGVGQGTGLGLSTSYGILRQSNGHINVYSEVARGSTFKIYLPQVDQPASTPLPRPKLPALPRGTETILLVEDDPSLLDMAADLLKRQGYTVLTAADGVAALNLKQQRNIGHIDLLLTDVVMPHMSGKELADRIQAIYSRTKILFTSAYTESAIVHQGILNEGVTLLQKPYTPSTLANKVREVLDRPFPPNK